MIEDTSGLTGETGRFQPEFPHPALVSVIVPAYEPDRELRRCIDSIRQVCESHDTCEIVVVMPARHVEAARALLPGERVIPESRPSIYGAMNDGVAQSSGSYLYFLGKDDIVLAPFEQMLSVLAATRPTAMFCDVYWGSLGIYRGKPSRWRLLGRNVCHQGVVYSRRVFQRHGPYLRKMRVEADKLLNIRLLWDGEYSPKFHYLRLPIAWYSGVGFSTITADPVFRRLYPLILQRYVGGWAAVLLRLVRLLRGR